MVIDNWNDFHTENDNKTHTITGFTYVDVAIDNVDVDVNKIVNDRQYLANDIDNNLANDNSISNDIEIVIEVGNDIDIGIAHCIEIVIHIDLEL